jgi:hypothetical protein
MARSPPAPRLPNLTGRPGPAPIFDADVASRSETVRVPSQHVAVRTPPGRSLVDQIDAGITRRRRRPLRHDQRQSQGNENRCRILPASMHTSVARVSTATRKTAGTQERARRCQRARANDLGRADLKTGCRKAITTSRR